MAVFIATFDWRKTSLGPISTWKPGVQTAVSMMLQSPVPIILLWGSEGYAIYNDAYSEFAADRHPQLLGQTVVDAWPEVADFNKNVMKQGLAGKALSYKDQTLILFRNGHPEEVTMDLNYSPILDEDGRPAGVMAIVVETTSRVRAEALQKRAEAKLRAEQERLNFVVQNATDIITVFDKHGIVKYQSPSIKRLLGRLPRPIDGKSNILDSALVHPDDRKAKETFLRSLIAAEPDTQLKGEFRMLHADGTWRDVEAVGVNLLHLPQLNGVILSSRDVTDRKRSEAAYFKSEQQKTAYFETTLDALITMNGHGQVMEFNPAAEQMFGYTRKEASGTVLTKLIAPRSKSRSGRKGLSQFNPDHFSRILNQRHELSARRKDGKVFPCELSVTSIEAEGQQLFIVSIQDITERKLAEDSLTESEQRFRTLADNIQNLAWIADPQGRPFWFNSRWYEYTGTTPAQMAKGGWRSVQDPVELPKVTRLWRHFIKAGQPFELLVSMRAADGSFRQFLSKVAPMRDEHGAIQQWIGTNTDVEDMRQRYVLEQRMEHLVARHDALVKLNRTKDEFIALASHQLRTPATAVKQYVGILLGDFIEPPLTGEQRRCLQTAYDCNERELNIINELLKTAQIDADTYQINTHTQDIVPIIHDCIATLQPMVDMRNQVVTLHIPAAPVTASVDATEIGLVFTNLLENASKYSQHGSSITVTLKTTKRFIVISVADNGVGISRNDQHRIFEKFTRVDNKMSDAVSGTGLGLYWVRQIVMLHKGRVTLESTPGEGSVFTVRLPI